MIKLLPATLKLNNRVNSTEGVKTKPSRGAGQQSVELRPQRQVNLLVCKLVPFGKKYYQATISINHLDVRARPDDLFKLICWFKTDSLARTPFKTEPLVRYQKLKFKECKAYQPQRFTARPPLQLSREEVAVPSLPMSYNQLLKTLILFRGGFGKALQEVSLRFELMVIRAQDEKSLGSFVPSLEKGSQTLLLSSGQRISGEISIDLLLAAKQKRTDQNKQESFEQTKPMTPAVQLE